MMHVNENRNEREMEVERLRDELRRTKINLGASEEVAGQWMLAAKANAARENKALAERDTAEAKLADIERQVRERCELTCGHYKRPARHAPECMLVELFGELPT